MVTDKSTFLKPRNNLNLHCCQSQKMNNLKFVKTQKSLEFDSRTILKSFKPKNLRKICQMPLKWVSKYLLEY